MVSIIHISADYPDAYSERKTQAVRNLVEDTHGFESHIYSINRLTNLSRVRALDNTGSVTCLTYGAPPYGVFLETFLNPVADWILRDCQARKKRIDVVHGHKFSIEGLIARRLARALGCPYICSIRGNTDQKYLRAKPGKLSAYRDLALGAACLLPITPWIERYFAAKLGVPLPHAHVLPTITQCDRFIPSSPTRGGFVTAFHLDFWRPKGMPKLLSAIRALNAQGAGIELDIIGGGSKQATEALAKEIADRGLRESVRLLGAVDHAQMQQTLNRYTAFVLPTLRETFGMVYIEALFSGIPILYSKDRGVDGFFDHVNLGYRCDPTSIQSIKEGLVFLRDNEAEMKRDIVTGQNNGVFDTFRKSHIRSEYRNIIEKICRQ